MNFSLSVGQQALQRRAQEVGAEFRLEAASWDSTDRAPYRKILERIDEAGLLGLMMPSRFGGQGLTALDYLIVVEALFRGAQHWVVGEPVFATSGPGPAMILLAEQEATREKFLPALVGGAKGCAIALTEPDHGSDLTSLETYAEVKNGGFVINGSKRYITGATENELYAVFVRFESIPGAAGIGAVIVEEGMPGFTTERGAEFVGLRGVPHGNLSLDGVVIPAENLILGPGKFARLMSAFNMERVHNSGFNLGMAQSAYDEAVSFVEQREAFGRAIIEFQATYHTLADMWTTIEAGRLLAYRAAANARDGNFPDALEVTIAKLFGSTAFPALTLKSLELHGGYGVTMDAPVQRIHRDVISAIVAGGSPAVLRNSIAALLFPHRRFTQRTLSVDSPSSGQAQATRSS